jgi:hypothetical protein
MEFIFPYREEYSRLFGMIYRPVVPVELQSEQEWFPQRMYLDSGADISLIPRSVGDLLGFEMTDNIQEMRGVGNVAIPVIIKTISVRLCDEEFFARIAWSLMEEVPLILGRIDIFDRFEIIFMQKEKKVVLYKD